MNQLRAVFFDMEGVLIESESHWRAVGEDFIRGFVTHWSAEDQRGILGKSIYSIYALLVEHHGLTLSVDDFLARYHALAKEIYGKRATLIVDTFHCLQQLHEAELPLALVSSAPKAWIEIVVQRFELAPYFKAMVSSDDAGLNAKPAPAVYTQALKTLGLPPESVVAVEDSKKGVASAQGAGICTLVLQHRFNANERFTEVAAVTASLASFDVTRFEALLRQHHGYE